MDTSSKNYNVILCAVSVMVIVILFVTPLAFTVLASPCENDNTLVTAGENSVSVNLVDYHAPERAGDDVSEGIASFVEKISLDDSHGYSQSRRLGNPDYDCSSLVWFATKAAGYDAQLQGWPFTTFNMGGILQQLGFIHFTWSGNPANAKNELQRGDIVVNPFEHTEVYIGGGLFAGAHHAYPSGIDDGNPGDQGKGLDQEIGISPHLTSGLTQVYRHDQSAGVTPVSESTSTVGASTPIACHPHDPSQTHSENPDGTHASPEEAKAIAKRLIRDYYPDDEQKQYDCLVPMWDKESGWRWNAENTSSGAYGIPQSLPASKMSTINADWKDNATTQVTWGLEYIKNRYRTPCEAWKIWQTRGWY